VPVYLPARFRRSRRYPLVVAYDGEDYLRFSGLKTVLDNLIERFEIAPMAVALTMSPDRLREYGADPRHARFVAEELVPTLQAEFPVGGTPAERGLMGASFGAVAALHAAWSYPGRFGRLLLQSGSFAFSDIGPHRRTAVFDPVAEFVNRFREEPGRPAERIYLSCGTYESLIYENRSLVPRLQATGMEVRYTEARDGHNWENWRDRLREALSWLFPGPLWMVYE
jgi:enterochelin esterase family protein